MSLLKKALEEGTDVVNPEESTIVMQGPLSEIYTKALNIALAKPDAATGEVVMESQANDAIMQANLIKNFALAESFDANNPATTIYGISKAAVSSNDVVDVISKISKPDNNADDFIVVIDATSMASNPSGTANTEKLSLPYSEANQDREALIPVLESLSAKYNFKIAYSLEEAIKMVK